MVSETDQTTAALPRPPRPAVELFPRVRALVDAHQTEFAEATMRIPMANYRDATVYEAEMQKVFGVSPQPILPSAAIRGEGDYEVKQLADGRSVIVTRGHDGAARIVVNACRHRGAQVADGAGCVSRFTCPYHAWSYDTAGALVNQPGREGFNDVDPTELGLMELASEEGFGFVWFLPDGAPEVEAHLGEFAEELSCYAYGEWEANAPIEVEVTANWKCALEAFFETYHFPFVHKDSLVGNGSISNVVSFDAFGRHARLGVPPKFIRDLPADATGEDFESLVVIYFIYPNVIIANSLLGAEVIEARPAGAPNRSVLRHTFLGKIDPALVGQRSAEEYLAAMRVVILDEDGPAIASSGRGIDSSAHEFVLLGRNEPGCQHIHRTIQSVLKP